MVINSHPHNDHIWGNQAFGPEVDILSTTRTRELIITEGPLEIQGFRAVAQTRLECTGKTVHPCGAMRITRYHLKVFIIYFQAILATLPILQLRLPNLTL